MAEILGLVASVIQLAGTGLKLSQTLYQYADGVATADRRIRDIAKEIQLTSYVIEELGIVFKQGEAASLISNNALKTADETMKECSAVFAEIDATLKKSKKNTFGRLMLPFRDNKIELLRNHIDKLKSTLQLLMQVLTHAHQVASKKLDRETEARQREQIKELLDLKKKSAERYNQSLKDYSMSDASTVVSLDGLDDEDKDQFNDNRFTVAALALGSTIPPGSLETCVRHIRDLLGDIEALQQALTQQVDGDDCSAHHQNLLGSYFRARGHLDAVLLGNPHPSKESLVTGVEQDKRPLSIVATGDSNSEATQQNILVQSSIEPSQSISVNQSSIKFQDTTGKKYILPFHLYRTWQDIHDFVIQIYAPLEEWSRHASEGSFDLVNTDGEIIMPAHWNFVIQPGSSVTLQFWQSCKQEKPVSAAAPMAHSHQVTESAAGVNFVDTKASKAQPSRKEDTAPEEVQKHGDSHVGLESLLKEEKPAPQGQKHDVLEAEASQGIQIEIDDTVAMMRENILKVSERGARLDSLQPQTDNLAASTHAFRRAAEKQQSPSLFRNASSWLSAPLRKPGWRFAFGSGVQPGSNPELSTPPQLARNDEPLVSMPTYTAWSPSEYENTPSFLMSSEVSSYFPMWVEDEEAEEEVVEEEEEEEEEEEAVSARDTSDEVDALLKEWTNVLG